MFLMPLVSDSACTVDNLVQDRAKGQDNDTAISVAVTADAV